MKDIRDKMATGDDDICMDVLKLLGENDLRIMTQLITTHMKLESDPWISLKLQPLPYRSQELLNTRTIAQSAASHAQQR